MSDREEFRIGCERRCAKMAELKALIKSRKIRVEEIAWYCGCSKSNIYSILNGNWPYYGGGYYPQYFGRWAKLYVSDFQLEESNGQSVERTADHATPVSV